MHASRALLWLLPLLTFFSLQITREIVPFREFQLKAYRDHEQATAHGAATAELRELAFVATEAKGLLDMAWQFRRDPANFELRQQQLVDLKEGYIPTPGQHASIEDDDPPIASQAAFLVAEGLPENEPETPRVLRSVRPQRAVTPVLGPFADLDLTPTPITRAREGLDRGCQSERASRHHPIASFVA